MKLQITFEQKENKYKPISNVIEIESWEYYKTHEQECYVKALMNIAHNKHCSPKYLRDILGYTKVKVREYDTKKIELNKKIEMLKRIQNKRNEKVGE